MARIRMYHRLYWTTITLLVWHLSSQPAAVVRGISRTFDNPGSTTDVHDGAGHSTADTSSLASESADPLKDTDNKMMKEGQFKIQRAVSSPHMYPQSPAACESFVVGDPQKPNVIYSPGYPNNYPNNTDCVRILEAEMDRVLRLDFRDSFAIEPSDDCKFDYLEIRDGAHGFSNKLGQFCGHEFPPIITSKDRHLWLHFHSDDNIEYSGFTAIYESIERPSSSMVNAQECNIRLEGDEGWVNQSEVQMYSDNAGTYGFALDCMWTITVKDGWKIQLAFDKFKLAHPNDCDRNFVDIFDGHTDIPSRKKNFCGSVAGK